MSKLATAAILVGAILASPAMGQFNSRPSAESFNSVGRTDVAGGPRLECLDATQQGITEIRVGVGDRVCRRIEGVSDPVQLGRPFILRAGRSLAFERGYRRSLRDFDWPSPSR